MSFTDYYKELGVPKTATAEEIKKSFRKLAREFHPDTNPDNPSAEERFKRISEAYDVLGDADKRAKYDQLSSQYSQYQRTGQRPGGFGQQFNMDDVNGMFSGTSFGDMLSELFGQRTASSRGRHGAHSHAQHQSLSMLFRFLSKRRSLALQKGLRSTRKRSISHLSRASLQSSACASPMARSK